MNIAKPANEIHYSNEFHQAGLQLNKLITIGNE